MNKNNFPVVLKEITADLPLPILVVVRNTTNSKPKTF